MKNLLSISLGFSLISLMAFSGCELETVPVNPPDLQPAGNLVINEVFTLPPTHHNTYSWIEFYNPTSDTINLTNWTLSYNTIRLSTDVDVDLDTLGNFVSFRFSINFDSIGVFDVPFAEGLFDVPGEEEDTVRVPPNGLFTIVNDEDRLLVHTNWGPGDSRLRRERDFFQAEISDFDTIAVSDSLVTIRVSAKGYSFGLQPTDQLMLKDPTGKIVDVIRMGDSLYTDPGSDPLLGPGNQSIGTVPTFESIARYAGGYFSGNTADDFYITGPGVIPIPHWYSQLFKE
jgi:hypothetical protein